MLSKASAFAVVVSVFLAASALGEVQVIPVPYRPHDPTIPHPAYNGRPTTFKAITRGAASGTVYFRWDIDGDGVWDSAIGRSFAPGREAGRWYQDSVYNIEFRQYLPTVDPAVNQRKLFLAAVEVAESFDGMGEPVDGRFATYPVMVFADVPAMPYEPPSSGTTSVPTVTWPDNATDEQLAIMKEAAVDDALWYLHKQMARSGAGTNTMTGYLAQGSYYKSNSARFLHSLVQNGHQPAYPPGTYNHNPAGYSDVYPLPPGALAENDFRYTNDPYAEDAVRLLNYLYSNMNQMGVDGASEADDGRAAIPGTNNGMGRYVCGTNDEFMQEAWCLAAIAAASPVCTTAQYGPPVGHSLAYVVQEMVDVASYLQIPSGASTGGWAYWAYGGGDAVWPTGYSAGLIWALSVADSVKGPSGVIINSRLKGRLANYLWRIQNTDGGTGMLLGRPSSLETTGFHLLGCRWLGFHLVPNDGGQSWAPYSALTNAQARQVNQKYVDFITTRWNTTSMNCWDNFVPHWPQYGYNSNQIGDFRPHSLLNTRMAARHGNPPIGSFGTHSIAREFHVCSIKQQYDDGHYYDRVGAGCQYGTFIGVNGITAEMIAVASEQMAQPVAAGLASPMQVLEGCVGGDFGKVTFSHAGSYHPDSSRRIVDYQWLFDVPDPANPNFDAVNWAAIPNGGFSADGKAWHSTSRDATPVCQYMGAGTCNAVLRVVDDGNPPSTDVFVIAGIIVTQQQAMPPTANAGGPYQITAGEDLVLAGQASDPNCACDPNETLNPTWYLDADEAADFTQLAGTVPWAVLAGLSLPAGKPFDIRLVVTDSTGRTAESTAPLTILYPEWTLTVGSDPAGVAIAGAGMYPHGSTATLAAPPNALIGGRTYDFVAWQVDGLIVPGNPIDITMDADKSAVAFYALRIHTLTVRSFPTNDVSIAGSHAGTTDYAGACGDKDAVNLTAPSTIMVGGTTWYFEYWLVDTAARLAGQYSLQLTMTGDHVAIAVYSPRIAGDMNSDCRVNVLDLIQVRNRLGAKCSQ